MQNNMKYRLVTIAISVLLVIIVLSGCTENTETPSDSMSKFVGTWISDERGATYNFSSDGSFSFFAPDEEYEGTFEIEGEKLRFTYTSPTELEGEEEEFDYSFSENDTIFTISPAGYPEYAIVFTKQ